MKIRLILRCGIADCDGRCVGFEYKTTIIEMLDELGRFEVVGGEKLGEDDGKCLNKN
jgi:hypothetical protein